MAVPTNYTISFIRGISTLLIVITHLCLYFNFYVAYWCNIAVQIFFFISGYLYGTHSEIVTPQKWIIKQYKKLSIPYYIYLSFVIIISYLYIPDEISIKKIIISFTYLNAFFDGIPNVSHLWFLPYILICYITTPLILQPLYKKNRK